MEYYIHPVAYVVEKSGFANHHVQPLLALLDEGATIPFIARYRKEVTGSMDEVQIEQVYTLYGQFKELEKRKKTVIDSIEQQGKLTPDLRQQIEKCMLPSELEDVYLPYKPKRQTRASKAKERGVEPLAAWLIRQEAGDVRARAAEYVKEGMETEEEVLQGARDIIAEWVSENERSRNTVRRFFDRTAQVVAKVVKGKEAEGEKFLDYFDYSEALRRVPSHRMLAIRRGEGLGILKVKIEIADEAALAALEKQYVKAKNDCAAQVSLAVRDGYKRLLLPSIESEYLHASKQKADEEAIKVFAENLRQLLLAPPLGSKRVLAIDPGYRTGCKVVCLAETGQLLYNETIYPHPPRGESTRAAAKLASLVDAYRIEAIAIGNGTAGRETEQFVRAVRFNRPVLLFAVSENGASIYSASKVAREEFPEYDVTVRGAISIGRRLMDPLAELVKIDPKSIGVGQYQHDVDQARLKESLDRIVASCVNRVGVNVNTASQHLLTHVSGLGPVLAENIVEYIRENAPFRDRQELKKVKRMGEKAYEQCAGFLRIEGAKNPLDNSSVHPESYPVVERMVRDLGIPIEQLIGNEAACAAIDLNRYVDDRVGLPTLRDIVEELKKPGRDPRPPAKVFSFAENIHAIEDLVEGMVVPGIVTNITNFGLFVDIGVKQDGLVHVSEIAEKYIANPANVIALHQHVMVKVLRVDRSRGRIILSMRQV
ncbi:MAG: RNA-binding transcriptional accessory protein [Odoribacteraceae bacterium]|jgi:uncharacterized protein|nr:RNA-binding transcriptional accessory protein [Odoribacteraceae bacterium]